MLWIAGLLLWILLCVVVLLGASYAASDKPADMDKRKKSTDDPFAYLFPFSKG
ncbi:hypothetical protein PQ460_12225 [Paenibacillus sp. KACC 21273]|uniref:hypothetical protein n=1 Tax=Paenibacillus sp. KACC 21273 TaxID=3025665 RepID=UPI002366014F|nr:hypothetical protein [Paenibacillus sp. KACC 21273]WDF48789.1 hypothetical protein PQ460_12225 [Paenibacillus sp. KACC 21273]